MNCTSMDILLNTLSFVIIWSRCICWSNTISLNSCLNWGQIQCSCVKFEFDFIYLEKTTFCVLFFSSLPWLLLMVLKKTTHAVWHQLVLSWCTIVSQVKKRFVQDSKAIDYVRQHHTPHCWLPDNVMYWLTR